MFATEYTPASLDLLAHYYPVLAAGIETFIEHFYDLQETIPERAQVLRQLSPERYQHLHAAQARHLRLLLDPKRETSWRDDARRAGQIHYRHGVLPSWVADSYTLYWRHLLDQVEQPEVATQDRHFLRSVLVGRLLQDLAWQLEGYAEGSSGVRDLLLRLDHLLVCGDSEAAMIGQVMEFLVQEGGADGAWFGQPDNRGNIIFSAYFGAGMAEYLGTIAVHVDDTPQGQGAAGRAWRTGEMQITANRVEDWPTQPSQEQAQTFPWQSDVVIPLAGTDGKPQSMIALLSRQRGFFDHPDQRLILAHLAAVLGLAMARLHLISQEVNHREALERLNTLYRALMAEGDILLRAHNERGLLRETCRSLATSRLFTAAWIGRPDAHGVIKYLATAGRGAQTIESIRLTVANTAEGQSLAARAWRAGRLHYSNDYVADPSLTLLHHQFRRYGWRASVAIPIFRHGLLWGVFVAIADRTGIFDEATLELLARITLLLSHALDAIDLKVSRDAEHSHHAWLAHHDPLTGLPNRTALTPYMDGAMARTRHDERLLAVGMLDLDDFKPINDRYGHAAGDLLLTTLAGRLTEALRQTDFVARIGGDEFVLILEDLEDMADLELVLAKIRRAIEEPFIFPDGYHVSIQASLGLTCYPFDKGNPDLLLRHADQALYTGKEIKRTRKRFWTMYQAETMGVDEMTRRQGVRALFAAGGLRVYYQPIIGLESGQVTGVEALARLADGADEILVPARFLSLLSVDERRVLTQAVLAQALQDVAAWGKNGFPLAISINVEPALLIDDVCLHCLTETIGPSGIDPARVTLEILEYEDFVSISNAPKRLLDIKAVGVRLALDDIGSAYSSLLRLKELPIDEIKLDQSFVRELAQRPANLHFAHSLLGLAHGLGVDFVAEGAETSEILDALGALGAAQAQGYAIARPMPAPELLRWLQSYRAKPWHEPTSLLGLYASHLRFSDTIKTLLMQVPGFRNPMRFNIATINPLADYIAHMGVSSTPIGHFHRRYQKTLMALPVGYPSDKLDLTAVDKASMQFLASIQTMLAVAER